MRETPTRPEHPEYSTEHKFNALISVVALAMHTPNKFQKEHIDEFEIDRNAVIERFELSQILREHSDSLKPFALSGVLKPNRLLQGLRLLDSNIFFERPFMSHMRLSDNLYESFWRLIISGLNSHSPLVQNHTLNAMAFGFNGKFKERDWWVRKVISIVEAKPLAWAIIPIVLDLGSQVFDDFKPVPTLKKLKSIPTTYTTGIACIDDGLFVHGTYFRDSILRASRFRAFLFSRCLLKWFGSEREMIRTRTQYSRATLQFLLRDCAGGAYAGNFPVFQWNGICRDSDRSQAARDMVTELGSYSLGRVYAHSYGAEVVLRARASMMMGPMYLLNPPVTPDFITAARDPRFEMRHVYAQGDYVLLVSGGYNHEVSWGTDNYCTVCVYPSDHEVHGSGLDILLWHNKKCHNGCCRF